MFLKPFSTARDKHVPKLLMQNC